MSWEKKLVKTYEERERESEKLRELERVEGKVSAENQASQNSSITAGHLLLGDPGVCEAARTAVLMLLYLIHIK